MAFLTAPVLAVTFASPVLIAADIVREYIWYVLPMTIGVCLLSWTLNIGFLRFRERLGNWKWVQILVVGGLLIGVSLVLYQIFLPVLPPAAERLVAIRYVNAFAVNTVIYILIHVILLSESQTRLVEENSQLRLSTLETQYQILKDQVNPHFLFNALGTAKSLARRDPALTEAYIIRLSDFLRSTLQEGRDHVPLHEELRLVRDYVELQKMRFLEALVFECAPEVLTAQFKLPYFSLLTLVENAVKHNAMTPDAPLIIRITIDGDRITVWNNRQARALHSPSTGTGLSNLQNRCRILGHGEITMADQADSFAVTFALLPL